MSSKDFKILSQCLGCSKAFKSKQSFSLHVINSPKCLSSYAQEIDVNQLLILGSKLLSNIQAISYNDNTPPTVSTVNNEQEDIALAAQPDVEEDNNELANALLQSDDEEHMPFMYSTSDKVEVSLLKLLNSIGAPHYAFKLIMDWAEDAFDCGYTIQPKQSSYKSQLEHLQCISGVGFTPPTQKVITLAVDNLQVPVTCFDFPSMLFDLFNDPILNHVDNLVVNSNDPFAMYESPNGILNEVNSGHWYRNAYSYCIDDPSTDFYVPLFYRWIRLWCLSILISLSMQSCLLPPFSILRPAIWPGPGTHWGFCLT